MFRLCFEYCSSAFAQLLPAKHANCVLIHGDGLTHSVTEAGAWLNVLDSLGESVQLVRLGEILAGLL